MASSDAGSAQELTIGGTRIDGQGSGFTGLTLTPGDNTFEVTGGGLTTQHQTGSTAVSGSFGVTETSDNAATILGLHGARQPVVWTQRPAKPHMFTAVFTVSHTFEDRGARRFDVSFEVDGAIT